MGCGKDRAQGGSTETVVFICPIMLSAAEQGTVAGAVSKSIRCGGAGIHGAAESGSS